MKTRLHTDDPKDEQKDEPVEDKKDEKAPEA